jgi:hypothetical protein
LIVDQENQARIETHLLKCKPTHSGKELVLASSGNGKGHVSACPGMGWVEMVGEKVGRVGG